MPARNPPTPDALRKDDDLRWQWSGARSTAKGSAQGERGGVHQFGAPPMTALRGSAFIQSEAIPQVVSRAKDNLVSLPGQLFSSTQIPVCLWFFAQNKNAGAKRSFRDRHQPIVPAHSTP